MFRNVIAQELQNFFFFFLFNLSPQNGFSTAVVFDTVTKMEHMVLPTVLEINLKHFSTKLCIENVNTLRMFK